MAIIEYKDNAVFKEVVSKLITSDNLGSIVSLLVIEAKANSIEGNRAFQLNVDKVKNFFPIVCRNEYNSQIRYKLKATIDNKRGNIVLRPGLQNGYEYVHMTFTDALQLFKTKQLKANDFFSIAKFKGDDTYRIYKIGYDKEVLVHKMDISKDETTYDFNIENEDITSIYAENIIFFGSPGTGKSYAADIKTNANIETQKEFVEKTTFHPEFDYNSFVGGYKPIMVEKDGENKIEYSFVPQIFTNIYVKAWNNSKNHYYLQIEEINRGNCAEIFGDLFQLLDRDENGKSKYEITASEDLKTYLNKKLIDDGLEGIKNGMLKLPSNLSIVATMNTSDQSLFPMDSAFKRRWDWEYVPIEYDPLKSDSNFVISLNSGSEYKWLDFLREVNQRILKATHSQDKQVGNWFINAKNTDNIINEKTFINKVMFYLWNDVFKDEEETIFIKNGEFLTYEHFFTDNNNSELIEYIFLNNLDLKKIENEEDTETEVE